MPVRALSPALEEKATAELGESPEVLASGIRDLKEWIATQPHLRARTDDQWLAAFLRGCKFRLDQVKSKLDLYYTLRATAPDLYSIKYNDEKVNEILELGAVALLPQTRDPAAPRVSILRSGAFNPKEHTVFDVMAVLTFIYQISLMQDDNLMVAGVINIVDLRNTKFAHYTQASPKQLRNFAYAHQDALPVRIKEVHIVGAPYIFLTIMNFLKRFLNEKIKKRFYFHSSIDTLYEHVPKEILPEEYGGTGSSMSEVIDYWKTKFNEHNEFFEEDLKYGTDESKRVKEAKK